MTGSSTLNYAYDANGSLLTRKLGNTTQASYTYNADGRMSVSGSATLKYNAFGERSVETITGGGTHFLFSPDGMLLAEHTTAGTLVRNYVYLNGQPLAVVDAAGTISYVLNDQIGQPQKMLNTAGAISWQRNSGIFGDTVSQPVGTTASNPQRFPGQQFDPNLALHYNYFRDYDPATGRYLETDPIGLKGGMNVYAYVDGNPVRRIDPRGLAECAYFISTHTLACVPNAGGKPVVLGPEGVFSGSDVCRNNPACIGSGDTGPVPPGRYKMNRDDRPEHAGRKFRRLEPYPHHYGFLCGLIYRCGFELHPGGVSYGCITADKNDADLMRKYDEMDRLLVKEEGRDWLTVYEKP